MDSQPQSKSNWLKDVVETRSEDAYRKSMLSVFHRMRVVEQLVLREHEREGTSFKTDELFKFASDAIVSVNSARQENIKDFPRRRSALMPEWYEPYDLSKEVILDGVNWYSKMTQHISRSDFLIAKYFEEFNRKLFKHGTSSPDVGPDVGLQGKFSDAVLSLVTDNVYKVNPVGKEKDLDGDNMQTSVDMVLRKGSETEGKFIQSVASLSSEFDKLYEEKLTK